MIVGSDVVCTLQEALGVCHAAASLLHKSPSARLLLVLPHPRHRYGPEEVVLVLLSLGFEMLAVSPLVHSSHSPPARDTGAAFLGSQVPLAAPLAALVDTDSAMADAMDELFEGIEERDYFSWFIIVAKWSQI